LNGVISGGGIGITKLEFFAGGTVDFVAERIDPQGPVQSRQVVANDDLRCRTRQASI
jgi:hypothetical protein